MSEDINNYNNKIRHVIGKVDMNFYENTSDNDAVITTSFDIQNWRNYPSKQIISTGLTPKYKYASVDKQTFLNGTFNLYPAQPDVIIPLWSTQVCNSQNLFDENNLPTYSLGFYNKRQVNSLRLIGDVKRQEYPLAYEISIYTLNDDIEDAVIFNPTNEYNIIKFDNPTNITQETIDNVTYNVYTFCVGFDNNKTNNLPNVETTIEEPSSPYHFINLGKNYQSYKITLKIFKWNKPETTAKIMFFSNETKAIFENNQLASIKVLEEKTDNVEELSYGLTSNTCSIKVSNENDRFTKNPDLLKKNRVIKPFIKCKDNESWNELGTFYSDSWEVSSTSKYVTCKCYDILYTLQKMDIYYQMQGGETLGKNYSIEQNKTYYQVFTKVAELINKERNNLGIYGAEINFVIDKRLKNYTMPYVLIGHDTAWNILKELANQSLSFVYVDRKGNICVTRDELGEDRIPEENKTICLTKIDETNAFSYNLPTMSRAIVNRVKIPYLTFEKGKDDENSFEIRQEDITLDETGLIKVVLDFNYLYLNIPEIKRAKDKNGVDARPLNAKSIKCCYNKLEIVFNETDENFEPFYLFFMIDKKYKITNSTLQVDNVLSQKRNGVVEYELDCKNLYGKTQAENIANYIISEYADGKAFIEADWTGNPETKLGTFVYSRSDKEKELTRYEVVSNELTLENGLRFSSKSRQN